MITCTDAIRKIIKEPSEIYSTRENIERIYEEHSDRPWKEETVEEDEESRIEVSITFESDLEEYLVKNLAQIEEGLTLYSAEGLQGR